MKIAKSTYYYEISKVDAVAERNIELFMQIKDIFKTNKGKYDVQRTYEGIDKNNKFNHKRIQRIMHEAGLLGKRSNPKYHSYKGNCYDNCILESFFGRMKMRCIMVVSMNLNHLRHSLQQ
ncbi:MAG: IS3 family transposase [Schwartzia sp.]|nr:IS3 family transposase [Schwartzia sp. (in: firmicutes)]